MEMEYRDPAKRGKFIVVVGVVLALAAGGAAFYLINQAQQQAGQSTLQRTDVVVALTSIPARKPIELTEVEIRQVPLDPTNSDAIVFKKAEDVVGRVLSVTVLQGQMLTQNMLASTTSGGQFSILEPGETVAPDSEAWRAVSITVPDDRAVGGMLQPGMTVDVLMSATVNVPQDVMLDGKYYTDKSTKITYQNMVILARTGQSYIVKATLTVAEEVTHLLSSGNATFSMVMRPEADIRNIDVSKLGATTNRLIAKYGLPVPEVYPPGNGPLPTPLPFATSSPAPSASPVAGSSPVVAP
jgi:Flp pilus assembly protein CpaB